MSHKFVDLIGGGAQGSSPNSRAQLHRSAPRLHAQALPNYII